MGERKRERERRPDSHADQSDRGMQKIRRFTMPAFSGGADNEEARCRTRACQIETLRKTTAYASGDPVRAANVGELMALERLTPSL